MSIATEIQRLQTAKEEITRALLRAGYDIPSGITLDEYPPYIDPYFFEELTFNIISGGTIKWVTSNTALTKTIEYKLNDNEWTSITSNIWSSAPSISVSAGDIVRFRGDNDGYATSTSIYTNFYSSAKFEVEGNIMSLIDSTGFTTATTLANSYTFYNLFYNCTGLISAENLILPATTLASSCYSSMFYNCTSLTTAPALPATTLANNCYNGMFRYCSSLTTAPELPATTLADYCYSSMFLNCTSLTTAPELPTTTLASNCYSSMFYGCTSLTTAPALPATTLTERCYSGMFNGCTSLTTAPELPATALTNYCYENMFRGCASLTAAPALPATTLTNNCYRNMFNGCTSLNYIKCLATDISASDCTYYWVYNVAASGTFVKNPNMSSWTTYINGIPTNWTVQDAQMNPPQYIYVDNFADDFIDYEIYNDITDGAAKDVDDWFRKYMKGTLMVGETKVEPTEYEFNNNTFMFSGKTYYVYEETYSGSIYGLLPSEKADYYILHNNSMEYNNMNYKSNYHPFDYILTGDLESPGEIYDCRSDINQDILVKIR